MTRYTYLYQIVRGCGSHSELISLHRAKKLLPGVQKKWPDAEIERVRVSNSGRQYWLKRNSKWVNFWEALYGKYKDQPVGPWGTP